jgi:hypothetical protein
LQALLRELGLAALLERDRGRRRPARRSAFDVPRLRRTPRLAGIYILSAQRHPAEMILGDGAVGSGDAQEAGDT